MTDIISFTIARAVRRDFTLEDRVRARRARAAEAAAAAARQEAIRLRARAVLAVVLNEPSDPTSVA